MQILKWSKQIHTWHLGHTQTTDEWTRRGDEDQESTSLVSGSQSCPWWQQETGSESEQSTVQNRTDDLNETTATLRMKWKL